MDKKRTQAAINSQFLQAAHSGDLSQLVLAQLDGADVNTVHPQTGLQALHFAVGTNDLLMIRYLTEQCNAVFGPDRSGRWPTIIAAECKVDDAVGDYIVEAEAAYLKKTGQLAP